MCLGVKNPKSKIQNIKQKQYCNKFNKDSKKWFTPKKKKNLKKNIKSTEINGAHGKYQ